MGLEDSQISGPGTTINSLCGFWQIFSFFDMQVSYHKETFNNIQEQNV